MESFFDISDFANLIIYFAVFIGITIYSAFKTKNKKSNQNDDERVIIQNSNQNNTDIETKLKSIIRKKNNPYQINRNKNNNPIFANSTNNISYTRTLMIFLAVAAAAVLLIAYFTGTYESFM